MTASADSMLPVDLVTFIGPVITIDLSPTAMAIPPPPP